MVLVKICFIYYPPDRDQIHIKKIRIFKISYHAKKPIFY